MDAFGGDDRHARLTRLLFETTLEFMKAEHGTEAAIVARDRGMFAVDGDPNGRGDLHVVSSLNFRQRDLYPPMVAGRGNFESPAGRA